MTPDLNAIIEKLERAEGPSRELDSAIHYEVRREPDMEGRQIVGGSWRPDYGDSWGIWYEAPPYTRSIDAALTLVPEGWQWTVSGRGTLPKTLSNQATLQRGEKPYYDSEEVDVSAATPTLALCIAALKARAA